MTESQGTTRASAAPSSLVPAAGASRILGLVSAAAIIAAVGGWTLAGSRGDRADAAEQRIAVLEQERDALQGQLAAAAKSQGNMQAKYATVQGQRQALAKERDALLAQAAAQQHAMQAAVVKIQRERDNVQAKYANIQDQRRALAKERDAIQAQRLALEASLKAQLATKARELGNLQAKYATIQDQRRALNGERDRLQAQYVDLKTRSGDRDAIAAQVERLRVEAKATQDQMQTVRNQMGSLHFQQGDIAAKTKEVTDLMVQRLAEIDATQGRLAALRQQEFQAREAVLALQQQAKETAGLIAVSEKRLSELQLSATEATQTLSRLTGDIASRSKAMTGGEPANPIQPAAVK
ncbi:hypothetical protein [Azospirillum sp. SYSU D00513]|uniref:hypothetical protein n=1 Tax=Azospirillum sp. SYSU D00513 TaxID=2812561 RepID=UPI001A96DA67|nr:hypothetical protein [Azospirillum sp. SYSU D00513]